MKLSSKKTFNLQILLETAYRSQDPQSAFKKLIVTQALLDRLIPPSDRAVLLENKHPPSLYEDLFNYFNARDEPTSDDALYCKFVYFATAMIHVFSKSAAVYISPNVPIPYIWINVPEPECIQLINYSGLSPPLEMFRVSLYTIRNINSIECSKLAIELNSGTIMQFSQGNAIHVKLKLDEEVPELEVSKHNPVINCVVLLSLKGEFCGAWHRGNEKLICMNHG